ncbi:MAG: class F sortase [Saccharothrix sp.]|nr:class F sortase [Saccharothrix sp.]
MRCHSRRHPRRSTTHLLAGMAVAMGLAVLPDIATGHGVDADHAADSAPVAPAHDLAGAVSAPTLDAPEDPPQGLALGASRPTRLTIPKIGVDTVRITDLGLRADRTLQVPADADTVGWYTNSPTPGEAGPALLTAHVDWRGRAGVFHDLRELEPGDQVVVERADGSTATFTVRRVEQHPKDRFPTRTVYGPVESPELRLVTCGGRFDRTTGSYRDNLVVYAEMTAGRHHHEPSAK